MADKMKYIDPSLVLSPKGVVEFIELVHKEHNDQFSYSVAKVIWDGKEHLAMRWNISRNEYENIEKEKGNVECKGMPVSRGYPVWFILPQDLVDRNSDLWKKLDDLSKNK